MRKLILSMNITLDGFIAGPHCELDWHFSYWNNEMSRYASEQLALTDTILLGRVTYNAMAKYWPSVAMDRSFPREDVAFADMMNTHAKIVFSGTLKNTNWYNSTLIAESAGQEVIRLKQMPGKDMIIYGSSKLAQSLIRAGLIDEYILWTYPVILGEGKPLFHQLRDRSLLRLVGTKIFSSGVVVVDYQRAVPSKLS
ncbi:MAG: dihydrofolate reductase [Chitinophagaceae bacterium]|nr:MAG: dihydrofolate reductase [Chitinophagaceae bacterium]